MKLLSFFSEAANPTNHFVIPKLIPFKLKISDDEKRFLDTEFTAGEVKKAVMEAKPEKAPGPDSYPGMFYQRYWDLVGDDVTKSTLAFFMNFNYSHDWAANFITLIPKKFDPSTFADYRPISLSNFRAKVISKMMANHLKGFVHGLISLNQSAFIKNRRISDNLLLS